MFTDAFVAPDLFGLTDVISKVGFGLVGTCASSTTEQRSQADALSLAAEIFILPLRPGA